ncbi:MAG TPA: SDR family NAD(P)-dependent oxidoreductase [Candidatus Saccharimonadales bacterium]|nr:SDR family NAD(P)-dependent oxidoreductase [Candidatus Saccharimonadales bacterium]
MNLGLKGKTAIVMSASKGLGRASALALAKEGAHIIICSRDAESLEDTAEDIKKETGSKILVNAESREEADRLFHGLSAGGEIEGPIGDSPWGSYAGMFRDKYGIEWIIEFSPNK